MQRHLRVPACGSKQLKLEEPCMYGSVYGAEQAPGELPELFGAFKQVEKKGRWTSAQDPSSG